MRHILLNDGTRTQSAIDETPPRIPRISQIDGKDATDDLVASRNAAPMIAIDQVTNGHTADVYLESDGTTGLQPATDTKLNPQPIVAASGATFQLPALGGDGERTFYATATDTNGNTSVDSNNGTLGYDDATYRLDTVKPTASAARTDGQKVTVTFTEALSGGRNDAADWQILHSVTGAPMAIGGVSGTGSVRVLDAAGVPNGSRVVYNPQPEPTVISTRRATASTTSTR